MTQRNRARPLAPTLGVAALVAAAFVAAGCGSQCKNETPVLDQWPSCPPLQAGAQITVDLRVCPSCSNAATCAVDTSQVGAGFVFLEPQAQVCQDSCPLVNPSSCPYQPLSCTFTAPAAGSYTIMVADPNANTGQQAIPITVSASGATSCTFGI